MTNFKYFNGETQLVPASVFFDSKTRKFYGTPEGFKPYWIEAEKRWERGTIVAERSIQYKSNPSCHECDDRCLNATGRAMKCECACGGKNHGRGRFVCE
jgi:hypothetical protein